MRLVHSARSKAIKCPRPWCELEFTILADMVKHRVGCLKVCPTCSKTFQRSDKFNSHMRAHKIMEKRMLD